MPEPIIPLPTEDVCKILNLPADLASNPVFEEHQDLVMVGLEYYTQDQCYEDAASGEEVTTHLRTAFRMGYAFLMLYSVAELLNLKTVGEGIVKTIGIDQAATELLTGAEIEDFKNKILIRALEALAPYGSHYLRLKLSELTEPERKPVRARVI